jgi:hypothetical protein
MLGTIQAQGAAVRGFLVQERAARVPSRAVQALVSVPVWVPVLAAPPRETRGTVRRLSSAGGS